MKKYTPNFNDPRVVKRINTSLDYAIACLSPTKPKQWGTRQLDVWFGNQGNPLSKFMRSHLLTITDPYYNPERGVAKKYLLNLQGAQRLGKLIGREIFPCALHITQTQLECANRIYGEQIAQGTFEYRERSNRMWNDIQNLANSTRKPLFANYGYIYEYDIKSSAPNILAQYSRHCGLRKPTPTVDEYLADPTQARLRLEQLLHTDSKTAKQLITSRFAGARFGPKNSIITQLNRNWHQYNTLKQDDWFELLSKDIKLLWDSVRDYQGVTRLNSSAKWNIYFSEELRVMRAVHKYLDKTNVRYFHEHDGWRSTGSCDIHQLKLHIHKTTGYWLDFDEQVYEINRETVDYS